MKKRIYRRVRVKDVAAEGLLEKLPEPVVIVALDVAKHAQVAAFAGAESGVAATVSFRHPEESPAWLALVAGLVARGKRVACWRSCHVWAARRRSRRRSRRLARCCTA